MTEPIMIDGVDVSGCEGFKIKTEDCMAAYMNAPNIPCTANPDCIYKQLQRKTAECKDLKNKLQIATEALENYARIFYCTEADCEPCLINKTCAIYDIKQALERIKE